MFLNSKIMLNQSTIGAMHLRLIIMIDSVITSTIHIVNNPVIR